MSPVPARERGYAMVAAVAGIAAMATIAATLVSLAAPRIETVQAETTRARLIAAADAGTVIALGGLTGDGLAARWTLDGEVHELEFAGVSLRIHIEDEHGKFNLARINDESVVWLLETVGYGSGPQREALRWAMVEWTGATIDPNDEENQPPDDPDPQYYDRRGILPRHGTPATIDEMGEIRGMTPNLLEKLRPVVTADAGNATFDPAHANPLAIQAMSEGRTDSPEIIERRRALAGQRTAFSLSAGDLKNRTVSVVIVASLPGGAELRRRAVATLSGSPRAPWAIRYVE